MTYQDALDFINKHEHLIGTADEKGFVVSQLVIVPADKTIREEYLSQFVINPNFKLDESLLVNNEVEVWSVDTTHLVRANVLFYNKLG